MHTPSYIKPLNTDFSLLHFNARSIKCKFSDISAELSALDLFTNVIFITETWLSPHSMSNHYILPGYSVFHSFRSNKGGGGALIFIRDGIPSAQLSPDVTPNNAYNACAVTASQGRNRELLLAVYRPTSTTTVGTDEMCDHIDNFAMHYNNIVMAGDFNFSGTQWSDSCSTNDSYCQTILCRLMVEHHLT